MANFCSNCGTQAVEGQNACARCGAAFPVLYQQQQPGVQQQSGVQPQYGGQPQYYGRQPFGASTQPSGQSQHSEQPQYGDQPRQVGQPQYGAPPPIPPKKSMMKIIIPICAAFVVIIAFLTLWLTGVFSFGGGSNDLPEPTSTRYTVHETGSGDEPSGTTPSDPTEDTDAPIDGYPEGEIHRSSMVPMAGGNMLVEGGMPDGNRCIFTFIPNQSGIWEIRIHNEEDTAPYIKVFGPDYLVAMQAFERTGDRNAFCSGYLFDGLEYQIQIGFFDGRNSESCIMTVTFLSTAPAPDPPPTPLPDPEAGDRGRAAAYLDAIRDLTRRYGEGVYETVTVEGNSVNLMTGLCIVFPIGNDGDDYAAILCAYLESGSHYTYPLVWKQVIYGYDNGLVTLMEERPVSNPGTDVSPSVTILNASGTLYLVDVNQICDGHYYTVRDGRLVSDLDYYDDFWEDTDHRVNGVPVEYDELLRAIDEIEAGGEVFRIYFYEPEPDFAEEVIDMTRFVINYIEYLAESDW